MKLSKKHLPTSNQNKILLTINKLLKLSLLFFIELLKFIKLLIMPCQKIKIEVDTILWFYMLIFIILKYKLSIASNFKKYFKVLF